MRAADRRAIRFSVFAARRQRTALLAAMVIMVTTIGGCSGVGGGISTASAESLLKDMDGVVAASVTYDELKQSTRTDPVLDIKVAIADGRTIANPASLAESIARVGWSAGDQAPTGGMSVSIASSPQVSFGAALERTGWSRVVYDDSDPDSFALGYNGLTDRWGSWPVRNG